MVIINGVVQTKNKPEVENVYVTILVSIIITHSCNRGITLTHTLSKFFNHNISISGIFYLGLGGISFIL